MGYVIFLLFLLLVGVPVAIIWGAMWVAEATNSTLAIVLGLYFGGICIWMLIYLAREYRKGRAMYKMKQNATRSDSIDDSQGDT